MGKMIRDLQNKIIEIIFKFQPEIFKLIKVLKYNRISEQDIIDSISNLLKEDIIYLNIDNKLKIRTIKYDNRGDRYHSN